jgi:tRNA (mo5U34)-methyltransferase
MWSDIIFKFPVTGKSVLDIGSWDGYFSFQAERLGATRVLATDHFCWSGPGWGTKAGFDYVHERLGSSVESKDVDVFDLDPKELGKFDVVLLLGVIYHLTDPFGGLKKAADMCDECLIVETHSDMNNIDEPVMRYYLGTELANDPTNFWGPNAACLEAMMREIGFTRFEPHFFETGVKSTRLFVHAWR